jgi:FSR family fosmidomycin resistance protein-like MFS transporter
VLAAAVIIGRGQGNIAWFALLVAAAIAVLVYVSRWHSHHLAQPASRWRPSPLPKGRVYGALAVLALLVFQVHLHVQPDQLLHLLPDRQIRRVGVVRRCTCSCSCRRGAGTFMGGPIGDRIGRKRDLDFHPRRAPFTLALPYVNLFWTAVLTVVIGFVISSAFPPSWCLRRNSCRARWA